MNAGTFILTTFARNVAIRQRILSENEAMNETGESMSPLSAEALREDIQELKKQGSAFDAKLDQLQRSINAIAVQDERIKHVEASMETMWRKHDQLRQEVDVVNRWQASCPREQFKDQFKWVWWVLVPQGLMMIGFVIALIEVARNIAG